MITFSFNGEKVEAQPQSIEQFVHEHIGSDEGVAVAVDGAVVPRSQWNRDIQSGNVLDVLTAVQGG
ncbi:sulfur carrier protein ThiS [Corynebacterium ammoniagenes]|uniref:Thiamine biosynthesis protein ThiS n=2 Tax=Corynebacterium ammoniagenes TaxID=1697 RepID=A0AAV5G4W8_CORAM|nr:sulfur carrier protein ThiS [Corynebacterium ammoniagenes]APT82219.1 thiamine biosynthesis protein ThiS [Corynebacterium ammoniagenes DSM 20306]AQS73313.1 thiamine biosynthesis protein ThiS [Corynebacterium ammoniagenes]EFG80203.1 thiamine biosynthesis protein ThiS [Corynebacterium ammoniagenes DSM 20306]NMF31172.1 sulfur carrier protein ThiS [Corynebacterium ammoniagenes]GJN42051.1 thiamine biosynthesis protein ThiS [Corynebacterium ammoniagenes]